MVRLPAIIVVVFTGVFSFGNVAQGADPSTYSIHYSHAAYNRQPGEEDLRVPGNEDEAFLDGVIQQIFPKGVEGLSDEARCVEILRYASSALRLENNGGSATKIIREGYAICGGLSHVFRILCRKVELPARYIGAFYLRPLMGSHAISEVYYRGKWRLFDPTFGFFFYSRDRYDQEGEVASFHELVLDPRGWTPFKVVAKPWIGRYDDSVRAFGVETVEADYLKEVYGTSIVELYGKYAEETFPIAYGSGDAVSFPVDADLREDTGLRIGEADENSRDVVLQALNGTAYSGSHYLGGSTPPGFHTWSIRAPGRCRMSILYYSVNTDPPELTLAPLKAVRLVDTRYEEKRVVFSLQVIDTEAIVSVYCPKGAFIVDAMEIERDVGVGVGQ